MNNKKRDEFVTKLLGKMTLEEKVGQCFTLSWRGSMITPSVMDLIEKLHVGGLRIEPFTTESAVALYYGRRLSDPNFKPPADYQQIAQTYFKAKHPGIYITPDQYSDRINRLQKLATARPSGVPLHIATDYEGDFSHDYSHGGMNMFPSNMGLAACADPKLVYEVGLAMGRQCRAVGITMLHSPVCDVNVNAGNPEIGTRSFSDDPKVCSELLAQYYQGLRDGGIIAFAKHYPGRGDSATDAHDDLPEIATPRAVMSKRDLAPYRRLIGLNLSGVMSAHTVYPGLDDSGLPATLSRKIMHDLLRGELGFQGVISTDAMGMGAIVKKWGIPRACVMALKAGCNLCLVKNDDEVRSQAFYEVRRAVETEEWRESGLDESVRYVLNAKYDQGLFKNRAQVDSSLAPSIVASPKIRKLSANVAEKALILIRDKARLLPLSDKEKVLVIEQIVPEEFTPNDVHCNSFILNESIIKESRNVINASTEFCATKEEVALMLDVARDADVVVITNFYWRIRPANNTELVRQLIASGKKVIVVTNTPYEVGNTPEAETVLCTFASTPNSLRSAARFLYGRLKAAGKWPLKNMKR